MKKSIFIILLLFICNHFCFGQNTFSKVHNLDVGWGNLLRNNVLIEDYHSFVDTTLRWHEITSWHTGLIYTYKYKLSSDSVLIGNRYYHNMLYSRDEKDEKWEPSINYFREKDKKIWLNQSDEEYLLYNFGLSVLDTFTSRLLDKDGPDSLIVVDIDSILLEDGTFRRLIILECLNSSGGLCGQVYWIEGIGSICDGLDNLEKSCYEDFAQFTYLLCFYKDDDLLWYNPPHTSCFISTRNEDFVEPKKALHLYPNPTNDILHIQTNFIIKEHKIIDQYAKIVLTGSNKDYMDVSSLTPGVYFLQITLENEEVIFEKFVKY